MAIYDKGRAQLNDMERQACGATKTLDMGTVEAGLVTDDVVILGALPRESLTTDIRVIFEEGFDGDAPAFDIGFYDYNTEVFSPIASLLPVIMGNQGWQIVVPMPTTAQFLPDGTPYAGEDGAIWNGKRETIIAIQWKGGATSPTVGDARIVTTHTYYGTKDGQYGLAYVPMKPGKN